MPEHPNRAVFLDRDGTVIRDCGYLGDTDGVVLLPGAGPALARLAAAGYLMVVVTNQSGIGRGYFDAATVLAQQARLEELLLPFAVKLSGFAFCPHLPADGCNCRKPRPGMILAQAGRLGIDTGASFMVGDKRSDILAGSSAGCRTVLVGGGTCPEATWETPDLATAADAILAVT
jgi:D-glycero-D-manno-heptose 1,7-bisphosphate phosphatase